MKKTGSNNVFTEGGKSEIGGQREEREQGWRRGEGGGGKRGTRRRLKSNGEEERNRLEMEKRGIGWQEGEKKTKDTRIMGLKKVKGEGGGTKRRRGNRCRQEADMGDKEE